MAAMRCANGKLVPGLPTWPLDAQSARYTVVQSSFTVWLVDPGFPLVMKVTIIGAGGIGGYVGATLALAGEDVTFIARGRNLEAIRNAGIKLIMSDGSEHVTKDVHVTDDYDDVGDQEVLILAMKAHQLEA